MEKLILASKSPRRRELFALICPDYECEDAHFDESALRCADASERAKALARGKCESAAKHHPEAVTVGCDTVVCVNGEILEKPADRADALRMLSLLSSARHTVYTGVCIISHDEPLESFVCASDVEFFAISDEDMNAYADTDEPYDKAGAYGIQGAASRWLKRIDGDYFNIVGLPVSRIFNALRAHGIL